MVNLNGWLYLKGVALLWSIVLLEAPNSSHGHGKAISTAGAIAH